MAKASFIKVVGIWDDGDQADLFIMGADHPIAKKIIEMIEKDTGHSAFFEDEE